MTPRTALPVQPVANVSGTDRKARRFALALRQGLFGGNTRGTGVTRAVTAKDHEQAYSLVHDTYVETGYILPDPSGMRVRVFEAVPEMATYIAKTQDDTVVATLGVVPDSPDLGLPSDEAFSEEIDALRNVGMKLCETTNQAVRPDYRGCSLTTEMLRCMFAHAAIHDYDEIIAAASPGHVAFYELMGFRQIGSLRSYSKKVYDPVVALSWRVRPTTSGAGQPKPEHERFLDSFLYESNPYRGRILVWEALAQLEYDRPEFLRNLFVLRTGLLNRCSESELAIIRQRWGEKLYNMVTATASLG